MCHEIVIGIPYISFPIQQTSNTWHNYNLYIWFELWNYFTVRLITEGLSSTNLTISHWANKLNLGEQNTFRKCWMTDNHHWSTSKLKSIALLCFYSIPIVNHVYNEVFLPTILRILTEYWQNNVFSLEISSIRIRHDIVWLSHSRKNKGRVQEKKVMENSIKVAGWDRHRTNLPHSMLI